MLCMVPEVCLTDCAKASKTIWLIMRLCKKHTLAVDDMYAGSGASVIAIWAEAEVFCRHMYKCTCYMSYFKWNATKKDVSP